MTNPRVVVEQIQWVAVGESRTCVRCGHEHYPRQPSNNRLLAAQWGFCEDETCGCVSLVTKSSQ